MPDLRGNLSVFQPNSVMQMLNLAMATGELKLKGSENSASIYFEDGNITFAGIKNRPVKIGEYLVRAGVVTQEVLDEVLVKRGKKRKRIGVVLIEGGHMSEVDLRRAVIEQIKDVIFEVVGWEEGAFTFHTDNKPRLQEIRIDIPLDHLMLEGLKRLDEEKETPR